MCACGALAGCTDYSLYAMADEAVRLTHEWRYNPESDGVTLSACPSLAPLEASSPIDESCDAELQTGPLLTQVEWSRSDFLQMPEYTQVVTAPMVGQLTDDDGDGRITRADVPDIVVVADDDGSEADRFGLLVVLSGLDGSVHTAISSSTVGDAELHPYRYATPALGDLDSDGVPEIVTVVRVGYSGGGGGGGGVGGGDIPDTGDGGGPPGDTGEGGPDDGTIGPAPPEAPSDPNNFCTVAAYHADGSVVWVSSHLVECAGHLVALAELDGDGQAEVLVGDAVLDSTGLLKWSMEGEARFSAYADVGTDPVAIDLDVDGVPEVLSGRVVYQADGTERCRIPDDRPDGFPAAADLDGDGLGEFVLAGDGQLHVYDDDCTPKAAWAPLGSGNGGPPTIADFDGDGKPEIGLANAEVYAVYEVDGTLLWSQPCTDASSHATGSSVFDFDGDGQSEVIYADEVTLWVFDGATGAVRLQDTSHTSRTLHELPTVADVDGDGEMEIVVPQGGGHYGNEQGGLYVLGSAGAPWLGDRQVWNQHAWTLTNVADDLVPPWPAVSNWPYSNTFRSGDLAAMAGGFLPDAWGDVQACTDRCLEGRIGLQVRLYNGGMATLREGVPITVYAVEPTGDRVLATFRSPAALAPGEASAQWELSVPVEDLPAGELRVRVDDDGGGGGVIVECHEDNNDRTRVDVACPE